jgi:hypothetical protein
MEASRTSGVIQVVLYKERNVGYAERAHKYEKIRNHRLDSANAL